MTSVIIGNSVTSIGADAFRGCKGLTNVTIPDSVTSIGDFAFRDSGLKSINIGSGVKYIGESAFWIYGDEFTKVNIKDIAAWCQIDFYSEMQSNPLIFLHNLYLNDELITELVIPNSVTNIGGYAFSGCTSLTSVTIPGSVSSIGIGAFSDCTGLTYATIDYGLKTIDDYAFFGCTSLINATIPNSVSRIGQFAFGDVLNITYQGGVSGSPWGAKLQNGYVEDGIVYNNSNKTAVLACSTAITGSIVIPDSVTSIGNDAFYNCSGLTSITIPNSVTSIGVGAFFCVNNINYNGTASGSPWGAKVLNGYVEDGIVYNNSNKTTVLACSTAITGSIVIPDSVTSIGNYAFENCTRLTSITIPDSVTSIGNDAFYNCTGLASVTIGNSVTSIGSDAFYNCTGLTSITIPDSVTSIGNYAFKNCYGLTSVNISDISKWCKISFSGDYSNPLSYADNFYINGELVTDLVVPDSVTSIGSDAFYNCTGLTSITIPDSVTSIGDYAFYSCTGLTSVIIGNSVTSIGADAFRGCKGLTNVTIPDSVTSIGNYAFYNCTRLTSVTIGNSVKSIGNYAFYNCSGLTSVTIPDSVTSIGDSAFYNCTGLKEITMPCSAKTYNSSDTFYNCTNIEKVTLTAGTGAMQNISSSSGSSTTYYQYTPWYISRANFKELIIEDGVKSISSCAFSGCTGLTSVTIPNSVTSIGSYAFSGCTGLTSVNISDISKWCKISFSSSDSNPLYYAQKLYMNDELVTNLVIPDSVKSISSFAFSGCTGLTSVVIPNSVTSIRDCAFEKCSSLTSVSIPTSVISVGSSAFSGCTGLTKVNINDIAAWCKISFSSSDSNPLYYAQKLYMNDELVTALVIPDSVTSIGSYAFYNCTGLKEITMPCSAQISSSATFYNCYGIEKVTLTAGTGTMQNYTATNYKNTPWYISRTKFKELVIEYGVKNIGSYAFYNMNLTDIYYTGTNTQWNRVSKGSSSIPSSVTIHCNYIVSGSVTGIRVGNQPSKKVYHKDSEFNPNGMTVYAVGIKIDTPITDYNVSYDFSEVGETSVTVSFVFEGTEYTAQVPVTVSEHLYKHVVVPSTCTEEGTEYDLCTECGEVANESIIPKLPHSYVSVVTVPTCTEQGYTTYTCSCGESYIDSYVNALNHDFGEWVVTIPATCTKNGIETRYCSRCDVTETRETDLAPHSYSHIVESSTCTKEGQEYDLCTECGEIINVSVIEKLPHNLTHAVIPASCSGAGSEFDICIDCGAQVNVSVIPALEHRLTHIHTDATCTEIGEDYDICEVCGQMFNIVETQKLSHNLTHSIVEATCTEDGSEYDVCSECGQKFNEVITPATGHDTTHVSVTKTCTVDGEEYDLCSKCGEKLNHTVDKAKGHNYTHLTIPSSCTANGMEFDYCIVCQTQDNVTIVPAAHTWGEWNITTYPTTISDGTSERICGKCGTKETKTLAKTISNCVIEDGTIYGLSAGMTVDSFTANNLVENGVTVTTTPSDGNSMGTGSKVVLTYPDGQTVEYEIVVFGDTNGDAWYDGTDSIIVNCLANGLLSREQVGEAVYMAADCNHDDVIDEADVALLEQAGIILAGVDQSKSEAELMTDSAYVEYLSLIDQSPAEEVISENITTSDEQTADKDNSTDSTTTETPSAEKTTDSTADKIVNQSLIQKIFTFIIKFISIIKSIFVVL